MLCRCQRQNAEPMTSYPREYTYLCAVLLVASIVIGGAVEFVKWVFR